MRNRDEEQISAGGLESASEADGGLHIWCARAGQEETILRHDSANPFHSLDAFLVGGHAVFAGVAGEAETADSAGQHEPGIGFQGVSINEAGRSAWSQKRRDRLMDLVR